MTLVSRESSEPKSATPAPVARSPVITESCSETSEWAPQISTPVSRIPRISSRCSRTSFDPAATPIPRSARPAPSIVRFAIRTPWPRAVTSDQPPLVALRTVVRPAPISRAPLPSSTCGT